MNETLPEAIAWRAAEAEMRRLYALRDSTAEELRLIELADSNSQVEMGAPDGAAIVARALAGDESGAAALMRTTTLEGRADYLRTLLRALIGQIETHGFKMERLEAAAWAADEPRRLAEGRARQAQQEQAYAAFQAKHPPAPPIVHDNNSPRPGF